MGYMVRRMIEIELADELAPGPDGVIPGSERWWDGPWTAERLVDAHLQVAVALRGERAGQVTVRVTKP